MSDIREMPNNAGYRRIHSRRGAASALIILLLVLLVFFGVLALVTAAADLRLAEKRSQWAVEYYMADALAASVYADIEDLLEREAATAQDERQMVSAIDEFLGQLPYVAEKEIQLGDSAIYIDLLATADADSGQGINMLLKYERGHLQIVEWLQWQAPLQALPDREDIWRGE